MTLTKDDVQVIRKMLREEIMLEIVPFKEEMNSQFVRTRVEFREKFDELTDRIKNLEIRAMNLEKKTDELIKEIKKLKKDLKYSVDFMDKDYLKLKKQVDAVEAKVRFVAA